MDFDMTHTSIKHSTVEFVLFLYHIMRKSWGEAKQRHKIAIFYVFAHIQHSNWLATSCRAIFFFFQQKREKREHFYIYDEFT